MKSRWLILALAFLLAVSGCSKKSKKPGNGVSPTEQLPPEVEGNALDAAKKQKS